MLGTGSVPVRISFQDYGKWKWYSEFRFHFSKLRFHSFRWPLHLTCFLKSQDALNFSLKLLPQIRPPTSSSICLTFDLESLYKLQCFLGFFFFSFSLLLRHFACRLDSFCTFFYSILFLILSMFRLITRMFRK